VSTLSFTCNVCGTTVDDCPLENIDREVPSCPTCASTVRMRSVVYLLSVGLFGKGLALPHFPDNRAIKGIGLSDWTGYARPLAEKLDYVNSFYHIEPRFDITAPGENHQGQYDFLISSDVFEHVPPPARRAFEGARHILKPGGVMVFTVPFSNEPQTVEHYPDLCDFQIITFGDERVLVNRDRSGRYSLHTDLVFHGGDGSTLEMRIFCRHDLERLARDAGFSELKIMTEDAPEWGILHKHPWSLPMLARTAVAA
jgi:SAM-dependent methyltransferase